MVRYTLALLALTLLACNGCKKDDGTSPNGASTGAPSTGETVVQLQDEGKTFDVARGATVTFKLESNAGTGYAWMPSQVDAKILAQQGDRTSEVASDTPGAPKRDVFRFTAQSPGSTAVEMGLKRPFDPSGPAARTLHVTVNVH
jgi:predicted secreted protein